MPAKGDSPWGTRARRYIASQSSRLTLTWITRISVVALLAASALFGGLEDAELEPLDELGVGDEFEGNPLSITVERAVLADEISGVAVPEEPGDRLLLVVATMENLSDEPIPAPRSSMRVGGLESVGLDDEPHSINLLSDDSAVRELQPRISAPLVLIWDVAAHELVDGAELRLGLFDLTFVQQDDFILREGWQDPELGAIVTVDVEDIDLPPQGSEVDR